MSLEKHSSSSSHSYQFRHKGVIYMIKQHYKIKNNVIKIK